MIIFIAAKWSGKLMRTLLLYGMLTVASAIRWDRQKAGKPLSETCSSYVSYSHLIIRFSGRSRRGPGRHTSRCSIEGSICPAATNNGWLKSNLWYTQYRFSIFIFLVVTLSITLEWYMNEFVPSVNAKRAVYQGPLPWYLNFKLSIRYCKGNKLVICDTPPSLATHAYWNRVL